MNSKRRCAMCKKYFPHETGILARNGTFFCCQDHMTQFAFKTAKGNKRETAIVRKVVARDSDRKRQFKLACRAARRLARALDKGKPCISCGVTKASQWDGGHFLSMGAHPEMACDMRNIHRQCTRCNMFLSGNVLEYMDGLIQRYGEGYPDAVRQIKSERMTGDELKALKKVLNKEALMIEKGGEPTRDWRAFEEVLS